MRLRYLLRFAIRGDLRFISHRDTIGMFERVLARAEFPVRYSEGFNPRVRLWLPLPRSVGTTAVDEVLIFETVRPLDTEQALARMQSRSPIGLQPRSLKLMESSVLPRPVRAHYQVPLGRSPDRPAGATAEAGLDLGTLGRAVERFISSSSWPIERRSPGRTGPQSRPVDLRPLVDLLRVSDGSLRFALPMTGGVSARPAEVLSALGLEAPGWVHRLRRTRVEWDPPVTA